MRTALLITFTMLAGCGGPFLTFPGRSLTGPEESLAAARFPAEGFVIELETNPADPYSVNVNALVVNGALYVDPVENRNWYQNMLADPNVRLKITSEGNVYAARAVREHDPDVISRFDADRVVMRLDPR